MSLWRVLPLSALVCSGFLLAQQPAASTPDPALIQELVLANRILANEGVLDAYGHVSVRDPKNPNHFWLARGVAAGTVTPELIGEYDLEAQPVNGDNSAGFIERYIHSEIYRARPEVMSVIHSHAPDLVTFSISSVPLRPVSHMAGFIADGVPVFEVRKTAGISDMLIRTPDIGKALAKTLGDKDAVLLRGHGAVVTGPSLHVVVGRAYYLNFNARLLLQAVQLNGLITYLEPEEARKTAAQDGFERAWNLWKSKVEGK